jgi:hypothetical protein
MVFGIIPECRSASFRNERSASPESPPDQHPMENPRAPKQNPGPSAKSCSIWQARETTLEEVHENKKEIEGQISGLFQFREDTVQASTSSVNRSRPSVLWDSILGDGPCALLLRDIPFGLNAAALRNHLQEHRPSPPWAQMPTLAISKNKKGISEAGVLLAVR